MRLYHVDAYKDLKKRLNIEERQMLREDWSLFSKAEEKANAVEAQLDQDVPFETAVSNAFSPNPDPLVLKILRNTWFWGQKLHSQFNEEKENAKEES